jgi:hypothetical protein
MSTDRDSPRTKIHRSLGVKKLVLQRAEQLGPSKQATKLQREFPAIPRRTPSRWIKPACAENIRRSSLPDERKQARAPLLGDAFEARIVFAIKSMNSDDGLPVNDANILEIVHRRVAALKALYAIESKEVPKAVVSLGPTNS